VLDLADPEIVISRTEGVTASFLKELLRRAALYAAQDEEPGDAPADRPLRVSDAHMNAALDRLLDTRSQLTRTLLGGDHRGVPQALRRLPGLQADQCLTA
jgi:hypothetical protein